MNLQRGKRYYFLDAKLEDAQARFENAFEQFAAEMGTRRIAGHNVTAASTFNAYKDFQDMFANVAVRFEAAGYGVISITHVSEGTLAAIRAKEEIEVHELPELPEAEILPFKTEVA